jgi:cytochrome c-type protein NapC/trimethylamine-N-oxide reductase (cytochrome c) cytochrome c-type subunit TorY
MPVKADVRKKSRRNVWLSGAIMGALLTVVSVLASGYMVEATNTDTFCVSCHVMKPFQTSWKESKHGGMNSKGFQAQCVDCHLPHGSFVEYLTAKAITGTSDVVNNMLIDPYTYDWEGAADRNRTKFTYDNACRKCHVNLLPKEISKGGLIAHRDYLRGDSGKKCASCHEHVGHKDMRIHTREYFATKK